MALKPAQKTKLLAAIAADPVLAVFPNTNDGAFEIAQLLNIDSNPAFVVWRSNYNPSQIREAITSAATQAALGLMAPPNAASLGIRPEDLDLVKGGGLAIQAKVVEMLGASQQVNSRVDGELIRLSTNATPAISPDQTVQVVAKPGKARWYDVAGHLMA